MKNSIYPCIWFDGNAKEAAELYCSIFNNGKITADTPMVVNFEIAGKKIMGLNGGPHFKVNPSISFFVLCESMEQTNTIWKKLIEGGKSLIPLQKQNWSEYYGWLQDKFGVTWQIAINDKEVGKQSITPSFLFVNEKFGKADEAILLYTKLFEKSSIDLLLHYGTEDKHAGKVLYSEFNLIGYKLIAMDGPGQHAYTFNEGVSLVVPCETQSEIDYFWDSLIADGGSESMCGWLKDKFGVSWQIIPENIGSLIGNPTNGARATQALLKMKKIEIASLENA